MFQLAFFTAQALGIEQQNHDAMYDAVWKGGELSVIDPGTRGLKSHLPTIEDAAKFYKQRSGVPLEKFVATSKSFSVDLKVRSAEDLIKAYHVDRTPTIVVNGKYRVHAESAGGTDQLIELVKIFGGQGKQVIGVKTLFREHPRLWISLIVGVAVFFFLPHDWSHLTRVVGWLEHRRDAVHHAV